MQTHHTRHIGLEDTTNTNQANQSKRSVYIQYTISAELSLIEHNHSNELVFAYFE